MNNFAERLRSALKSAGYTQKRATEELNLSKNAMTNYTNGRIPDATILYKLAKLLNVTMEWLLEGEGQAASLNMASNGYEEKQQNNIESIHIKASEDNEITSDDVSKNLIELTEDEHDLIEKYRQLSRNDREELSAILNYKYSRIGFKKGKSFTSMSGEDDENAATKELA